MKTRPVSSKRASSAVTMASVIKVERMGDRAVSYAVLAGKATPVKRTLRKSLKKTKKRSDLFDSPTLPEALKDSFRNAVRAAQRRYA